jgi:hypothetical protein
MPKCAMSTKILEQKIAELTERVSRLENRKRPVAKPTWRDAFGAMKDDDLAREAAKLGAAWRAEANKRR